MNRVHHARILSLAILAALTGCSGGGDAVGSLKTGGDFLVLQTEPTNNGRLFLNEPISLDFSNPVNLQTVDLNNFSFQVLDQQGNPVGEPVAGNFRLAKSPGDIEVGRRLQFVPRFPTNDTFDNGGFRPGRTYVVRLVGGSRVNGTVVRDTGGRGLAQPSSFQFSTADGSTPGQLFRNTAAGGPRRVAVAITPTADPVLGVALNKLGAPPVEIRLDFDQPLNPSSSNVPVQLDTNPLVRNPNSRGRVFLEYDDPVLGNNTWIPADVELESNRLDGATLVLRPVGVLPNNAEVRIIVESTLEDISGESNVSNAAYDRVFGRFRTLRSYAPQFDAVVEDFQSSDQIDLAAPFNEPLAEVGPGYVKAGFAFEGSATNLDFAPTARETVLNTNFTQVVPANGSPYNVSGGVFNFRSVRIDSGKTVRGQGTNPMVWLVSGSFEVAGELSVRGGNGALVTSAATANLPKAGGAGVCGGGDGGAGSPSATQRDASGGVGNGPLQAPGRGGGGGRLSCVAGCNRGAGGGGGALATQGDPNYKVKVLAAGSQNPTNPQPIFPQQVGLGGQGCEGNAGTGNRTLLGGVSGASVFTDARDDNNFWGAGLNARTSLRIAGELAVPVGGGGGGGGGDLSYNNTCNSDDVNFSADASGGGGGGGGGVLIVKALGPIVVRDTGRITADGGHGGGGEQAGSSSRGGGGGGGAGGMVVLMSATRIEINARGTAGLFTYQQNNYDFAISADGGVCVSGNTSTPLVLGKYPASGQAITNTFATSYDSRPLGAFGGMGLVQLMAPPGDNADGTNTILDDNIRVLRAGVELTGTTSPTKQSLLAWRGFPNAQGALVDDFGNPTNIGDNEGDIRPAPLLLPVPFAAKSRLRSKWIDTGASKRRPLLAGDQLPRGIVETGSLRSGPTYEFTGVNPATGYVRYVSAGGELAIDYPTLVADQAVESIEREATFLDRRAFRVVLAAPALGDVVDRYSQYELELVRTVNGATTRTSHRILSHTNRTLLLADEVEIPVGDVGEFRANVRAKFFQIVTDGQEGLGPTYLGAGGGSSRVPNANVRIGFAFHQNPADPAAQRFPATPGTFVYNLEDPAVQEQIRLLGAAFVQWDVLFDTTFRAQPSDNPPVLSPNSPRPELHFLRLPYRF